uniref:Protein RER1 n=1 Tax=Eptatretus burgeri TaxID=7764 RepID=A0A8C4QT57_EPTBU
MAEGDSSGEALHGRPSLPSRIFTRTGQVYQTWLDRLTPHTALRWLLTTVLAAGYLARVYWLQGWYIVTYALGIYHLNLFIAFLSPKVDPSFGDDSGMEITPNATGRIVNAWWGFETFVYLYTTSKDVSYLPIHCPPCLSQTTVWLFRRGRMKSFAPSSEDFQSSSSGKVDILSSSDLVMWLSSLPSVIVTRVHVIMVPGGRRKLFRLGVPLLKGYFFFHY